MGRGTSRRVRFGVGAGLLALVAATACTGPGTPPPVTPPATTTTTSPGGGTPVGSTCEQFGSIRGQGGAYVVQNNNWGSGTGHDASVCVTATNAGFRVSGANHNVPTNGAPGGYPSIFAGCHYGNCTTGGTFPARLSGSGDVTSTVNITTAPGEWNAAYDLWLDPTARRDGQNTGAEIMIWINHQGRPQPAGTRVGTATIGGATWEVWIGRFTWNVISYVRQTPTTAFSGSVKAFALDAARRQSGTCQGPCVDPNWYLTSVQFGFEPWVGGDGLAASGFSVTPS